jgi:ligand-binding SRPBCC domain-containing protein
MKYHHRFQVNAPLSEVISFHRLAASMGAITPPPIRVEIHQAPQELSSGDEMYFSLHLGPFQIRWLALIENMTEAGFTDRQLRGPFLTWNHQHSFNSIEASVTEVDDLVTAEVKRSLGEGLLGWIMWLGMPFLFAYRGWITRSLLERQLDAAR